MKRVSIRLDVLVVLVLGFTGYVVFFQNSNAVPDAIPLPKPHLVDSRVALPPLTTGGDALHDASALNTAHSPEENPVVAAATRSEPFVREDGLALLRAVRSLSGDAADTQGKDDTVVRDVDQRIDDAIKALHQSLPDDWKHSHERYVALRRYFVGKVLDHRVEMLQHNSSTRCMEFVRVDENPSDALYRVPCIPWTTPQLASVEWKRHGLYATFEHTKPRPLPALRVAVEMSGHMRTYRRCYASTVRHLLEPNSALLFAVTYPDVGDKRFGVREQERDLAVPVDELATMYAPHLAALYVLDVPTITLFLNGLFPAWFHLKQWSWMIYQLFTMDVAHDIATGHIVNTEDYQGFHRDDPSRLTRVLRASTNRVLWTTYDVMIRIRPDLYILGPIVVAPYDVTHFVFNFSCGGTTYEVPFDKNEIIRSPHHPNYEWFLDKLSDHSAVGFATTMGPFMKLFSSVRAMTFPRQNDQVFKHGNTAERMWSQHAERIKVKLLGGYGWHIMLRNPDKFRNSTHVIAKSERRRSFTNKVFGVTDPSEVTCPDPSGRRYTLPPKKILRKKTRA